MTRTVAGALMAPVTVVAVAVLVKGFASTGDGFSGGAILALGLVLQYVVFGKDEVMRRFPVHLVRPAAFVALFGGMIVAVLPLALGDPLLTHYPRPGAEVVKLGTIEVATAVAFDVTIFALVVGVTAGILGLIVRAGEPGATAAEGSPAHLAWVGDDEDSTSDASREAPDAGGDEENQPDSGREAPGGGGDGRRAAPGEEGEDR